MNNYWRLAQVSCSGPAREGTPLCGAAGWARVERADEERVGEARPVGGFIERLQAQRPGLGAVDAHEVDEADEHRERFARRDPTLRGLQLVEIEREQLERRESHEREPPESIDARAGERAPERHPQRAAEEREQVDRVRQRRPHYAARGAQEKRESQVTVRVHCTQDKYSTVL